MIIVIYFGYFTNYTVRKPLCYYSINSATKCAAHQYAIGKPITINWFKFRNSIDRYLAVRQSWWRQHSQTAASNTSHGNISTEKAFMLLYTNKSAMSTASSQPRLFIRLIKAKIFFIADTCLKRRGSVYYIVEVIWY